MSEWKTGLGFSFFFLIVPQLFPINSSYFSYDSSAWEPSKDPGKGQDKASHFYQINASCAKAAWFCVIQREGEQSDRTPPLTRTEEEEQLPF